MSTEQSDDLRLDVERHCQRFAAALTYAVAALPAEAREQVSSIKVPVADVAHAYDTFMAYYFTADGPGVGQGRKSAEDVREDQTQEIMRLRRQATELRDEAFELRSELRKLQDAVRLAAEQEITDVSAWARDTLADCERKPEWWEDFLIRFYQVSAADRERIEQSTPAELKAGRSLRCKAAFYYREKGYSYADVGKKLGVSGERARDLVNRQRRIARDTVERGLRKRSDAAVCPADAPLNYMPYDAREHSA